MKETAQSHETCELSAPEVTLIRDASTASVNSDVNNTATQEVTTAEETGSANWISGSEGLNNKLVLEDCSKQLPAVCEADLKKTTTGGDDANLILRTQVLAAVLMSLAMVNNGVNKGFSGVTLPQLTDPDTEDLFMNTWEAGLFGSLNFFGGMFGSLVGGPVNVRLGQRVTSLVTFPIAVSIWVLLCFAPSVWVVLACRFCMGLVGGIFFPSASVYILEITHTSMRGRLCGLMILFANLGVLLAGLLGLSGLHWRYEGMVFCAVLAVSFFGVLFLPNSPRWLVTQDRVKEAQKAIIYFRGKHYDADSELQDIREQVKNTKATSSSTWQQLQLLCKRPALERFCLVTTLIIFLSFSGYYAILAYSVPIFQATEASVDPYISAVICSASLLMGSCLQLSLVDRLGRRSLLIASYIMCSVCMAAFGCYFFVRSNNITRGIDWIPLIAVVIFVFFSSIGQSIIITLFGELLPTTCRSIGVSLAFGEYLLAVFLSTTFYMYMVEALGQHGTFWVYSGCCAALVFASVMFLPETRGLSLEEIAAQKPKATSGRYDNPVVVATDSVTDLDSCKSVRE